MHPLVILPLGVAVVIVGVLVFRLHAFLALVLAALLVGVLTPKPAIERYYLEKAAVENDLDEMVVFLGSKKGSYVGRKFVVFSKDSATRSLIHKADLTAVEVVDKGPADEKDWKPRSRVQFVGPAPAKIDSGDIVVPQSAITAARAASGSTVGERVASAFGNTCGKIGILIALAAIIGKCLLDSGSADRIVRSAMRVVGERGAPVAFVGSGFLLGIPVFFDTVFYLMIPLGKALRMRTGRNYLLYVLTIVAGGSMAHSLVPPTPGPLFVSEELGVNLGMMIVGGCLVGLFSSSAALAYAVWTNGRNDLPLRESPDFALKDIEEISQRDDSKLPPLSLALLPILLPVVLIAGYAVVDAFSLVSSESPLMPVLKTLGNKNIALAIATVIALGLLVWQQRTSLKDLAPSIQSALASGGVIILITSGGGAFGGMLQQTGVASLIQDLPDFPPVVIIILAFFITTAIRTAQGSATVAMITSVGVLSGFANPETLGCHPIYLALAIGCGSKPIAWMNDSGFWVICKMSGMTEGEGLKYITPMSIIMGLVGLAATIVGVLLWPMN